MRKSAKKIHKAKHDGNGPQAALRRAARSHAKVTVLRGFRPTIAKPAQHGNR
jgi:hypothetical protein